MQARASIEENLKRAATRLAAEGLMIPGDALSQRIPETGSAVLVAAIESGVKEPVWLDLSGRPDGLHPVIYGLRPDVGALLSGSQPWAGALARLNRPMPAIFDEQVRRLGSSVRRISSRATDGVPADAFADGANAYLFDDVVLCFGMELERLLGNVHLLEKCCKAFVLASATDEPVTVVPGFVRWIANRRLLRDEKEAAARHLRGERAVRKVGY